MYKSINLKPFKFVDPVLPLENILSCHLIKKKKRAFHKKKTTTETEVINRPERN